ncbi:MAG: 2-phospho-L-lactate guanylyltransferase [Pseudolabrys sp.]
MIEQGRIWAVVPVKQFAAAKSRLAPVLEAGERAELAQLMLLDVLAALAPCRDFLAGVVAATADPRAAELARQHGAEVVLSAADTGINDAVAGAVNVVDPRLHDGLMVVPSDIPHATPADFAAAAAVIAMPRSLAIAAAAEDGGTNLFACRPAGIVSPHFGPRSFERHCRRAAQAGIAAHVLRLPGLALDIDRPRDLRTFLALGTRTRTHDYLDRLRVADRLDHHLRAGLGSAGRAIAEVTP